MTGLALVSLMTGFLLVYSGFKAIDPRCLITKTFKPGTDCPRIDATEANPAAGALGSILPTGTTTQGSGLPSGSVKSGNFSTWNNVAANTAKATAAEGLILARFPGTTSGGICNCRHQRGTGSNPSRWSVHSVCGAVDIWPNGHSANDIINYAKSLPMVWDAWLDSSPGDVHVQVISNPPDSWIPPCAASGAARTNL